METNTTIELVGYGHPDRFADYIAEKILTECIKQDKKSKVAIEVLATKNSISLGGELTTKAEINFEQLVYDAIENVYGEQGGPNYKEVKVFNHIEEQSPELARNQEEKTVAGDQGVVYGYYDNHRFGAIKQLYKIMDDVKEKFDIAPDGKLLYDTKTGELSMSVCGEVNHKEIKEYICKKEYRMSDIHRINMYAISNITINPKGEGLIPGPLADTGVVGRKLMIDTFGAGIPHGGGAFCGKDPSKVDKTGIIIASYLAKEAAIYHGVGKALVELNYKIGDEIPKAYAYIDDKKIDISNTINLTLDQYINTFGLLDEEGDEYVLKGGVLSYIGRDDE